MKFFNELPLFVTKAFPPRPTMIPERIALFPPKQNMLFECLNFRTLRDVSTNNYSEVFKKISRSTTLMESAFGKPTGVLKCS